MNCKKIMWAGIITLITILVFNSGCIEEKEKPTFVDMSANITEPDVNANANANDTQIEFTFGVSSIETPQDTYKEYGPLIEYLESKTGYKFKLVQRKNYEELTELFLQGELDFARFGAGAYIDLSSEHEVDILVLQVKKGYKPNYRSYIIVHKDSSIRNFDDLRNKSFAFTEALSCSGYYLPISLLAEKNLSAEEFFSETVFSGKHDTSIEMVLDKKVDGASVASHTLQDAQEENPEIKENILIIHESGLLVCGPIVVRKEIPQDVTKQVRSILINMHLDDEGRAALNDAKMQQFIEGNDSVYIPIREMIESTKESLKYPVL